MCGADRAVSAPSGGQGLTPAVAAADTPTVLAIAAALEEATWQMMYSRDGDSVELPRFHLKTRWRSWKALSRAGTAGTAARSMSAIAAYERGAASRRPL